MRLNNVKTTKNVNIFGAFNYRCFMIKCSPIQFDELKQTGVLIEKVSVYDTFISIGCKVNTKRTQDLIIKAQSMGIQITYYGIED